MSDESTRNSNITKFAKSDGSANKLIEPTQLNQEEKILGKTLKKVVALTNEELAEINSKKGLLQLLSTKNVNVEKALVKLRYERELEKLQMELVKLQRSVQLNGRRVAILFEGRDAAGKGGTFDALSSTLILVLPELLLYQNQLRLKRGNGIFSAILNSCLTLEK